MIVFGPLWFVILVLVIYYLMSKNKVVPTQNFNIKTKDGNIFNFKKCQLLKKYNNGNYYFVYQDGIEVFQAKEEMVLSINIIDKKDVQKEIDREVVGQLKRGSIKFLMFVLVFSGVIGFIWILSRLLY